MKSVSLLALIFLMSCACLRAGMYSGSFGGSGILIGAGNAGPVDSTIIVSSEGSSLQDYTLTLTFNTANGASLPTVSTYISGTVSLISYPGGTPQQTFSLDSLSSSSGGATWSTSYSPGTIGNIDPNYTWDLALTYTGSSLGPLYNVTGWSLDITAVPEPVNVALGIFAGVFGVVLVARSQPLRDRVQRCRAAVVQWVDAV